jgi:hypothetical protein
MSRRRHRLAAYAAVTLAAAGLLLAGLAAAQSIQREDFTGKEPLWQRGPANAPAAEEAHILTEQNAHSLPTSEYIRVKAGPAAQLDPYIYYSYATHPAPVSDDLTVSLWVRSNRPGVRLLARLVLPHERDPNNFNLPLTALLSGEAYEKDGGYWQRLELRRPAKLVKDKQQQLQIELARAINVADAYIDRVVLNLYAGPGLTEVWVDDLEIGPVIDSKDASKGQTPGQMTSRSNAGPGPTPVPALPVLTPKGARVAVEYNREQLRVGGKNFLFRGIRHSDTPVKALRDAGLNTLFVSDKADPAVYEEAARAGFWLVPTLSADGPDPDVLGRDVARFQADDAVLFWYLGGDHTAPQLDAVARAAQAVRAADPQRPLAADAWDGQWAYSRSVDLLAAHRFPLMTSLELPQYRDWLEQRRRLARPGTFYWTWVQNHLQDWFVNLAYPDADRGRFDEPIGPQAEQVRLLTYLALSAGCRGLGFWSDRFLADSHQGRDRLLTLALLNQELTLLEPLLLGMVEAPVWIDTSIPEVKAAVVRCERGVLVLPLWLGKGAQFVPGQSAASQLVVTVPQVPTGTQPWLVSPGEVKSLPFQRVIGGTQFTLREFDISASVVFTADMKRVEYWQNKSREMVKQAAQWSYDLARVEIDKVTKVQTQLAELAKADLAPALPDAGQLLADARRRLGEANAAWNAGDYAKAYRDAQRSLRPLRILMRAQWEAAVKSLGPDAPPTASPYAVSFFTLPRHWRFRQELGQCTPGGDRLGDGDFERSDQLPAGWQVQRLMPEEVEGDARVTAESPHDGGRCLMLQVRPKAAVAPAGAPANGPAAAPIDRLEPTYLGVLTPPVRLAPGGLVRVSGWVKVDRPITASADGAMLFDSAGGEPLGVRLTAATKGWQKFTLYRRVPAAGVVQVSAALTGVGTVYFDDLKVEPLNGR